MRLFQRRPRRIHAVCGVHNEPQTLAVLYKGDRFYTYLPRSSAAARAVLEAWDKPIAGV